MPGTLLSSTDVFLRLTIGTVGAAAAAILSFRLRSLSASGALAAVLVGALAAGAGWAFAFVLLGFFISSTALSKFRRQAKERILSGIVVKGNERDAAQVIANGGVFALASLWYIASPGPVPALAAVGAIAAAAADTWGTEIGSLSESRPRSIITGHKVPAGTSGGITVLGAGAGAAAALFIGLIAISAGMRDLLLPCLIAGLAGSAADSFLGATVQSRSWCGRCNEFTERKVHLCGEATTRVSGMRWINNDAVNLLCTLVGALVACLWVL